MAHTEDTRKTVRVVKPKRVNVVLDDELSDWLAEQPVSASLLIRTLLRQAKDGKIIVEFPMVKPKD